MKYANAPAHSTEGSSPSFSLLPRLERSWIWCPSGVMRVILFLTFVLWPDRGGSEDQTEYISLVQRVQNQLPAGWRAEFKQFSSPAVVISSPPMRVISTSGQRISDEPIDGSYHLTLSVHPLLPPTRYDFLKAQNDALRAQLGPRSVMESEHNKQILAQIVPEPDLYDDGFSYSLYSSLRPADARDIDKCRQMFQRLITLFRVYPQSEFSNPSHYNSTLRGQFK